MKYNYLRSQRRKKRNLKWIKIILAAWFIAGLMLFMYFAITTGIEKHAHNECLKWQDWDKHYPTHYLLDWQIEQCKHFEIYFDN